MEPVNPTLHTGAIAALELALSRALLLDSQGAQRLTALNGCVFRLDCTRPTLDIYMLPEGESLKLMGFWDGPVTTGIRGSASDFAELAGAEDAAAALINGNIELTGDSAPLMELQRIIASLDLDWEAPLVDALGDVPGHQLAQAMRGVFGWGQQASRSVQRQLEEFIHEEARLSPPRQEVEDFYRDVEQLGQRVDRLQAKIQKLAGAARRGAE